MNIFRLTMKRIFTNKIRLGIMFIGPILFISAFVLTINNNYIIGVVDHSNSFYSQELIDTIKDKYDIRYIDETEITVVITDYEVNYVLEIPESFEEDMLNSNVALHSYYNEYNTLIYTLESTINDFLERNNLIISITNNYDESVHLYNNYINRKFSIIDKISSNSWTMKFLLGIGFLIQFLLYTSVATTGIILEDKIDGTYYRNFYAPVKLKRYLFENLLAFIIIAFLQVLTSMLFIYISIGIGNEAFTLLFFIQAFIILFIFSIVSICLGLTIINYVKKPAIAYSLVGIITTPLVMIGGCYWSKDMMNESLITISYFLPTTWAMDSVRELTNGSTFIQIIPNLIILCLFGICFFIAGIFKKVDVVK